MDKTQFDAAAAAVEPQSNSEAKRVAVLSAKVKCRALMRFGNEDDLGRVVAPGEEFECTAFHAAQWCKRGMCERVNG